MRYKSVYGLIGIVASRFGGVVPCGDEFCAVGVAVGDHFQSKIRDCLFHPVEVFGRILRKAVEAHRDLTRGFFCCLCRLTH